jgi:hypothetical protein
MLSNDEKAAVPLRQPLQALVPLALADRQRQGVQLPASLVGLFNPSLALLMSPAQSEFEKRLEDSQARWAKHLASLTAAKEKEASQLATAQTASWRMATAAEFERCPIGKLPGVQGYTSLLLAVRRSKSSIAILTS